MHEDTVCLLAGQTWLKDKCKDPDVLPKVNKANMAGMMESIKENLKSCHGVVREPLAYIIGKNIMVQTYGNYPKYETHDDEMAARMFYLTPYKNRLHCEQSSQ